MIQLHKHEDNTHRRKSLTNIKLEVTPTSSLWKKGCVTEAPPTHTHTHSTHPVKGVALTGAKVNIVLVLQSVVIPNEARAMLFVTRYHMCYLVNN